MDHSRVERTPLPKEPNSLGKQIGGPGKKSLKMVNFFSAVFELNFVQLP